jgi:hypothetical protein
MYREGWRISFLKSDCKTSVPKKPVFADGGKLWELAEHGGCEIVLEVSPEDRTRHREMPGWFLAQFG